MTGVQTCALPIYAGDQEAAAQEGGNDMFSFDLPHHDDPSPATAQKDTFDFDAPQPAPAASDDPFAELLQSTKPATSSQPSPQSGAGSELNSFSWDETPVPSAPGAAPASQPAKPDDDFASLFGDSDSKK